MSPNYSIFPNLLELDPIKNGKCKGILLDAYGVFWGGAAVGVLPGCHEMMEKLMSMGLEVGILSNSTQLSSVEEKKFLANGLSVGTHFSWIITSGDVTRNIFLADQLPFNAPRKTFWLSGGPHPKFVSHLDIFENTGYREASNVDEADFFYVSIPHMEGLDQEDPEVFRDKVNSLRQKNLPMICPNPDLFAHEGNPARAVVRQGSIAKMYEEMGGTVHYFGKPHQKAYQAAMEKFSKVGIVNPQHIIMVGDTPETDIRGARICNMRPVLALTGNMGDRTAHKGLDTAITDLPADDTPDYFIKGFGKI